MSIDEVIKALPNIRDLEVKYISLQPEIGYFTKEEKEEIKASLESLGATVKRDKQLTRGSDTHTCDMVLNGIDYVIWYKYEKTKEEKCAELKKQLADMGCHY